MLASSVVVVILMAAFWKVGDLIGYWLDDGCRTDVVRVHSDRLDGDLYIKRRSCESGKDLPVIVVSMYGSLRFKPDPDLDYVYDGREALYYRCAGDTLHVYAPVLSAIPPRLSARLAVSQHRLAPGAAADSLFARFPGRLRAMDASGTCACE
jgi:hypothetical protein